MFGAHIADDQRQRTVPRIGRVLVKLKARAGSVMPFRQPLHGPRVRVAVEDRGKPFGTTVEFGTTDRKSTRLNSSHVKISYADFCLIKKIRQRIKGQCR